jgi:hypothetical protein
VADHIVAECKRTNCPLDLRLLDNGCADFLLWESGHSNLHWKDLVSTRIEQSADHFRHEVSVCSSEERKQRERELVRAILLEIPEVNEQEAAWEQRTGKRKSAFYVRKREVLSKEFDV